jgi:galactokinase
MTIRRAFAPGRITLIGDHTDYAGGKSLPMAIELGTTATFDPSSPGPGRGTSRSTAETVSFTPHEPMAAGSFGAMVQALARELGVTTGLLEIDSTLPLGAGLSSSASLLMASALALGATGPDLSLAQLCQRAETAAGQPVGLLDQLAIVAGRAGCGLMIDFAGPTWRPIALDDHASFLIVHSGQVRSLADGDYAQRRRACEDAAALIGPLGTAQRHDLNQIDDLATRRCAEHVIAESERVDAFVSAMATGDLVSAGRLMIESHRSLAELFEVSTPTLDQLVTTLCDTPGIYGARLTGAGFGGCVVAMMEPGALRATDFERAWIVKPSDGAQLVDVSSDETPM